MYTRTLHIARVCIPAFTFDLIKTLRALSLRSCLRIDLHIALFFVDADCSTVQFPDKARSGSAPVGPVYRLEVSLCRRDVHARAVVCVRVVAVLCRALLRGDALVLAPVESVVALFTLYGNF